MIGKRVRELRLQKGIQQSFVARKLGYKSSSSLNDIEMGRRKLKADQIPLLAEILDVEVSDLFLKGEVRETRNNINSA
ncbi:helix-turn-helix domain-containing protein [Shouchella clausii]|uniref:helix-turn-helix domain-containing protein n=1 Tax=Shouchella clausii TaxID=79880 RepID=UPI000BA6677F|nr:helix-turn-helix transcriptional regulator [Shouchella clausii]PAE96744.1 transcriptional regulator [Shouchella clausii]